MSEVTRLIDAVHRGDSLAAERLFPLVYEELRRIARARMADERGAHTLQATALVHEAYLRLIGDCRDFDGRGHFFAAAAEAMRRILVEHARKRGAQKYGGQHRRVAMPANVAEKSAAGFDLDEVLALDEALEKFAKCYADEAELVKLLYFAGLSLEEAGKVQELAGQPRIDIGYSRVHGSSANSMKSRKIARLPRRPTPGGEIRLLRRIPFEFRMQADVRVRARCSRGTCMAIDQARVRAVFIEAAELTDAALRAVFLDNACAGDSELRRQVESLLAAHETAGTFLRPNADSASSNPSPSSESTGSRIGRYKLVQPIGEGGFGVVYLAEQEQPVRRQVALKIIKHGMDTKQVIARFEAERQALAILDHPGIARVYDGGATDSGRPYFVMELVEGVSVITYCDQHQLGIPERLHLFLDLCEAVQYAHQKGLIHRDLKPSNILVATQDNRAVVKVIDFGVARATQPLLTEKAIFTELRQLIGTPEYMSPEQAEGSLDIDTRSDVYALGVILYELLAGSAPFDSKELRGKAFGEMQRIIREVQPPRPSTRLSKSDGLPSIAANRGVEPKKLGALVHGELDWIVMKSLEKDRDRRYETANGFAMDVRRYLDDEAVQACPPSAGYRFRKFARRNKAALFATLLVMASLLAGTAVATWQAVVATRANRVALQAKETAEAREAETRAVLEFVQSKVFAAARPEGQEGGLGREVTLRKAVEAALPFVEKSFTNEPLIEARLRSTMGTSFWYLGEAKIATEQYEVARVLFTQHLGPDHPNTLNSMHNLAYSYDDLGRHVEAVKLNEETLALKKIKLGTDHVETLRTMQNLANSYTHLGREAEALKLREETLAIQKAKLGPDDRSTLNTMLNLALSYEAFGRQADALKLREETLALMRVKLGPDHPITLTAMTGVANSYDEVGRRDEALKLREETLALQKAKLGPDHPATLWGMNNLAVSYSGRGRQAEALELRIETLTRRKALLGPTHPDTLDSMHNLSYSYANLSRHAEALALREETLAVRKGQLGADHPETLRSMEALGVTYDALDRHAEALKLREETLALRKAKLGADHPHTLLSSSEVADSLIKLDRGAEALPIIDACLRLSAGKDVPKRLVPAAMDLRMQHFQKVKDVAGCLETSGKWEALKRTDAQSLYQSARFRAVCAAVIKETDNTPIGEAKAKQQADQAMAWLKQAIAAGYKDSARLKEDENLDFLRDREDFKQLLATKD